MEIPRQNYGVSLAVRDHTMLLATRHKLLYVRDVERITKQITDH